MNVQPSYTLASPPETGRLLRGWARLSRGTFSGAILLTDVATIVAAAFLTGVIYYPAVYGDIGDISSYVNVGLAAACIFVIANIFSGEYRLPNFFAFRPHARRTVQLWNVTLICLLMLGFMARISVDYSRGWIILFYFTTLAALIVLRFAIVRVTALARAAGLISAQRVCLIGTGGHVGAFIQHYEPWTLGLNIVGCRFLTPVAATASAQMRRETLDRDLAEAAASVRMLEPDAIYLLLPWSATEIIERCAETFLSLPVEIHLGPEQILHKFEELELTKVGPLASLQLTRLPLSRAEILQKRFFDLVFAAVGLLTLTPLLIAIAILIKLDSRGPIFFAQRRYGFNQQPFRIIKFRTMRTMDDGAVVTHTTRDDPRLTKIGRWLRRWNIDEIPQLFNVLAGDMSLVGPRPHAVSHDLDFVQRIALYARRHNVKPGITGWAQIHGYRGGIDGDEKIRKRVEHDLFYIDNWSLWLDLKIMARTMLSPNAYRNAF
ncbi:MAG TPA: undecaprenyl-phosphate glucose phosphotransferase [Xanthobacteraceae bacterium]|jgi:Undecaprenyl-phosphate glucose phosphotransferase|nr:undecaprenyl-phosphate glucose phosphotransferase [Xanthobacteraceae bacterium]